MEPVEAWILHRHVHLLHLTSIQLGGVSHNLEQGHSVEIVYDKDYHHICDYRFKWPRQSRSLPGPQEKRLITENTTPISSFCMALKNCGLASGSKFNPHGRTDNCVAVTIAKLLGHGPEVYQKYIFQFDNQAGMSYDNIYRALRDTKRLAVFQMFPPRHRLDDLFTYIDDGFDADKVGVCYERPNKSAHCVVYHKASGNQTGRFLDYQLKTQGEPKEEDIDKSIITCAFLFIEGGGPNFSTVDEAGMEILEFIRMFEDSRSTRYLSY